MLFKQVTLGIILLFFSGFVHAQRPDSTVLTKQFIYVLRLTPKYQIAANRSGKESKIIREHVQYLKKMTDEGKCYLAGRTNLENNPNVFGVVIFDASGIEEAKSIMENDPVIKNGIFQAEVERFNIVFLKRKMN